jgi:hypothetical protein
MHSPTPATKKKPFGSQGCSPSKTENPSAHKDVSHPERKKFLWLAWKFALPKNCIFVVTKVAPTVNFVFHAKFFGCSGEQPSDCDDFLLTQFKNASTISA